VSNKISIVAASRDDNYGDDANEGIYNLDFTPLKNIQRTKISIETNLDLFLKYLKLDFEYILIDWSPLEGKYLHKNPLLKDILVHPNIKNIIVEGSAVEKMNLNKNGFNEYFAKNVGIRNAIGEYILVINSDGLLSKKLVKEVSNVLKSDQKSYYFRPHSRIDIDPSYRKLAEGMSFYDSSQGFNKFKNTLFKKRHILDVGLNMDNEEFNINPNFYDLIGTPAAGDFTMSHRDNFIKIASGYYEDLKNPTGSNFRQTARDGQLLVNLILHGIYPKKLENSIQSFDHNKIERVGEIKFQAYRNHENWGFHDFAISEKKGNFFIN
tara:strand:+ start:13854 stop:14822 length:969 start_codon:yes stop_codon:yes gene_type:complete